LRKWLLDVLETLRVLGDLAADARALVDGRRMEAAAAVAAAAAAAAPVSASAAKEADAEVEVEADAETKELRGAVPRTGRATN
jgi:hypothetical protein